MNALTPLSAHPRYPPQLFPLSPLLGYDSFPRYSGSVFHSLPFKMQLRVARAHSHFRDYSRQPLTLTQLATATQELHQLLILVGVRTSAQLGPW